ncbi:MAG TPA: hypothetical protein PLP61_06295 [Nocardioides sp.]|uniref:hypothetical protein n=1 Tax=Nocardioides sp. TaxID=35761 RepID=UPI002BBA5EB4|nr:hypothetical protein [Nocardioides sp.]HQR26635.1 hypothetical protein [Nocardioides sp.]
MRPSLRRSAVAAVACAVVVTGLPGASEAASRPPHQLSGAWLARQLTDGLVHNDQFDIDDHGLSIDTAFGLAAVGGHRTTVREISSAVAGSLDAYITGEAFGDPGSTYAGPTAKALVLAQLAGDDPTGYGGIDLVARLESTVSTTAPTSGRIGDASTFGDYANVVGQALAVQGLAAAGSPQAGPTLDFLLDQQCEKGYFRLNLTADKTAADQTCDGGRPRTTSAPDTDATALAVLALQSVEPKTAPVRLALREATAWLTDHQRRNGSFGGGTSTEASNANSTGLAAWALAARGACRPAVDAATWVRGLQVRRVRASSPLATQKGAIAYDAAAYTKGLRRGITKATRDQWRRTTAQAAPAMRLLTVQACRKF